MDSRVDNIQEVLQRKITEHLGYEFKLEKYCSTSNDKLSTYIVTGSIIRYDTPVNVKATVNRETLNVDYWLITDESVTLNVRHIGAINLSRKACVSDPCYDRDVWCMAKLDNVKPGIWIADAAIDTIDAWGERVYVLELRHRDESKGNSVDWQECAELGVDSGMMSVFDDAYYGGENGLSGANELDKTAEEHFF